MKASFRLIAGLSLVLQPVCAVDAALPPIDPANAALKLPVGPLLSNANRTGSGYVIRDNRFIRPMEADKQLGAEKGIEVNSLLWFTPCSGLQLSGNEVIEPGPFLKHMVTATDTARGTGFDTGIREENPAPTTSVKN